MLFMSGINLGMVLVMIKIEYSLLIDIQIQLGK